jgi:hypothetical protein
MQPIARPPKLDASEYVYASGYKTKDACTLAIWDAQSDGQISLGEHPREVPYATNAGARRWAIALTGN